MKLMYSPGACSIGIHVLLEEIGKPYEAQLVNLREGGQFKTEFTSINPKSKVPTLMRDDGSVLTEYPAIAYWLARTNPDKKLMPEDVDGQARMLEALDYAVATIHMQGFSRLFRASNYHAEPGRRGQGEGARQGDGGEGLRRDGQDVGRQGLPRRILFHC